MKSIYDGIANYKNHKTPVSKSLDKTKTLLKELTKEAFRDDFNLVRNFVVEHILNNSDEEVNTHSGREIARKIHNWVIGEGENKANILYIPDPADREHISKPSFIIKQWLRGKTVFEDCEGIALFIAVCNLVMGNKARYVITANNPKFPNRPTHIYTEVLVENSDWVASDPIYRQSGYTRHFGQTPDFNHIIETISLDDILRPSDSVVYHTVLGGDFINIESDNITVGGLFDWVKDVGEGVSNFLSSNPVGQAIGSVGNAALDLIPGGNIIKSGAKVVGNLFKKDKKEVPKPLKRPRPTGLIPSKQTTPKIKPKPKPKPQIRSKYDDRRHKDISIERIQPSLKSKQTFSKLPAGVKPADGTIITPDSGNSLYYMDDGKKRLLNKDLLDSLGYTMNNVMAIDKKTFNSLYEGKEINSLSDMTSKADKEQFKQLEEIQKTIEDIKNKFNTNLNDDYINTEYGNLKALIGGADRPVNYYDENDILPLSDKEIWKDPDLLEASLGSDETFRIMKELVNLDGDNVTLGRFMRLPFGGSKGGLSLTQSAPTPTATKSPPKSTPKPTVTFTPPKRTPPKSTPKPTIKRTPPKRTPKPISRPIPKPISRPIPKPKDITKPTGLFLEPTPGKPEIPEGLIDPPTKESEFDKYLKRVGKLFHEKFFEPMKSREMDRFISKINFRDASPEMLLTYIKAKLRRVQELQNDVEHYKNVLSQIKWREEQQKKEEIKEELRKKEVLENSYLNALKQIKDLQEDLKDVSIKANALEKLQSVIPEDDPIRKEIDRLKNMAGGYHKLFDPENFPLVVERLIQLASQNKQLKKGVKEYAEQKLKEIGTERKDIDDQFAIVDNLLIEINKQLRNVDNDLLFRNKEKYKLLNEIYSKLVSFRDELKNKIGDALKNLNMLSYDTHKTNLYRLVEDVKTLNRYVTGAFINVTVTRTYTNDEDDLIKDTKYTNDFISDWLDESNDIDELYSVI